MNVRSAHSRGLSLNLKNPVLQHLVPVLCGIMSAGVMLLLFTAFSLSRSDPNGSIQILARTALLLSALISGLISARLSQNPLLSGAVTGLALMLLLTLVSLIPFGEVPNSISVTAAVLLRAALVGSAVLGAFLGRKRIRRSSLRYKKRRR